LWIEGEHGWTVAAGRPGEAGRQGLELHGIAVGHRLWHRWSSDLAAADQTLGEAVQEPGQQPPATEPGPVGQPAQDLGLDGEADGQTWPLDVFG
jgi:hypothetical protein